MTLSPVFNEALALHQQNRLPEAEKIYRQLLAAEPENFHAWHRLAILYFQQKRGHDALVAVERALKINPHIAEVLMMRGVLLQAAGRGQEARAAMLDATAASPTNAEGWYNLGLIQIDLKYFTEAMAAFDKTLALQPSPQAWHNRAIALQGLQRHAEALENFDWTLALAPGALPALYGRGETLLALGRHQDAVTAFDQVLAQDPTVYAAWNNRGSAQQRIAQFSESLASYDKALALRPEFAPSWSNRASALWGLRRYEEALGAYDKALELAPEFVQAWIYRSAVLYAMHQFAESLASLDRALAIEPGNEAALFARGAVLCESGRISEGLGVYRDHAERVHSSHDAFAPTSLTFKHRHDQEQRDYLAGEGIVSGKYHLVPGARVAAPAVNPNPAAEAQWQKSDPKMVVIDDFLSPEALEGIRRYCLGSTFWQDAHAEGYLGALPESGFGCPLLAQIAEELQNRFPAIFAGHGLRKLWGFKYDSSLTGINVHADPAAVNVNFWITPDEANLDPAHGGMVIWDATAPLDWNSAQYNGDVAATRDFLARVGAKSQTVPYRANRVVIFDSDLFHETDVIAFKQGYLNRRINVTLLFGRRVSDGS
jgi:tetratricopeptide (TPR) repeat protein